MKTLSALSHRLKTKLAHTLQRIKTDRSLQLLLAALGFTVAVGSGLLLWMQLTQPEWVTDNSRYVPPKKEVVHYSPLTGVKVKNEAATKRKVTAVMIENSTDARPQSGLKQSGVVFEAVAEGGITRFLALYQEDKPGLVGPVRSLRPYYVEWAAAFDPSVAHVGGSYRSLQMIRSGKYGDDIDQFFNPGAYWRANDRYAPHNVYTSLSRIDALNKQKGFTTSSFNGFPRADKETPAAQPTARQIAINVSSGEYAVSYAYDAANNRYIRSQGGARHTDREKGVITPKVVIAVKVKMERGFEDGYREQITTTGSGEAYVFQNGTVTKGTWRKKTASTQIVFVDKEGKEIQLNRGQTWITALANDRTVTWQ